MFLNKNKLIIFILITLFIALLAGGIYMEYFSSTINNGMEITIRNTTNIEIDGLIVTYEHALKDVNIPSIKAHKSCKLYILPKEEFSESSMKIFYYDKIGKRHEKIIIGYFEKNSAQGKVVIEINKSNNNGELNFNIISSF